MGKPEPDLVLRMQRLVGRLRSPYPGRGGASDEKPTFQGTESVVIRGLAATGFLKGSGGDGKGAR
jgi:hypothetical protein